MSVINTNVNSLVAQNALTKTNRSMSQSMEQLSTGKRINGAKDDAAGLAIASKMTAQIRGLNMAVRHGNDAISLIQVAEGATNEISNMLQRMRELAVQSANDTYAEADRANMDTEFKQLGEEIDRVATNTQWNKMDLLSGTAGAGGTGSGSGTLNFQIGANNGSGQRISITLQDLQTSNSAGLNITYSSASTSGSFNVKNQANAQSAIDSLDDAITFLNTQRADMGAKINRLTYAVDNLTNVSENTSASRSRIEDADYAAVSRELARTQILSQAGTAMLAQANQQPQSVLALLK